MKYCFGVDVGGTTVKIGLFQTDGSLLEKWEIKTRVENEGCEILPDLTKSLLAKLKEKEIDKSEVAGIGIGVPAPVTSDGIVNGSANLGWKYKEVRRELEESTGFMIKVGNDANIAALGEMWKGGGMGFRNMVLITLGTGVGGGIIIDGHNVVGHTGAGGEIGHLSINQCENEQCGCGKYGCLEQYASATGIARLARRRLAKDEMPSVLRNRALNAKDVFDAVKEGDQVAIEIAEEFGGYLGRALASVATLVDPAVFVIGGGVSRAGEILLRFIEEPYRSNAFFPNKDVKFALAQLGNDAGIYGGAKLVLE